MAVGLFGSLVACGTGENRVSVGNREGVLHFGNGSEPQDLDPHVVTGLPEHHIISALLEGLVVKNPTTLEVEPGQADRWEISEDGRVYRFHIRDDAKWSNGDKLSAEDFRWSWWRALQPTMGNAYVYMLYPILNAEAYSKGHITDFDRVGIKVADPQTLVVTLTNPTPYFMQLLDHYALFPVHRKSIEAHGKATERFTRWTRAGNFVGNGVFNLVEWKLNRFIEVRKNPNYWDAGKVRLNGIIFYPTENQTTEERMYRAGQLHRTTDIPIEKVAVYRATQPDHLKINPYLGTYFYRINTKRPQLADPRVRRALAQAIDRKTLVEKVLKKIPTAAFTFTPPDILGYQPPVVFDDDVKEAQQLLADAGYPNGEGFAPIEVLFNTHEAHRTIAVAIQQMWKLALNIDVKLINQDWKVYLDSVNESNYDIARAGWVGDYVDPNTFLDMMITDGGNNRTGWSNAQYDELVLKIAPAAKNRDERHQAFREAEKLLMEEMPLIPIYIYSTKHLVHPSVKGMPANVMDFVSYKYVYLENQASTTKKPLK